MGNGHTKAKLPGPVTAAPAPEAAPSGGDNGWAASWLDAPSPSPSGLPPLLAAAAAPPLTGEDRAGIEASARFIAESLKEQWLDPWDEQAIVDHVAKWAAVDDQLGGTARLDALLTALASRAVTRATARSGWVDTTVVVLDTLWYELEDGRLDQFRALVARSGRAPTGPTAPPSENLWQTIGVEEAKAGLEGVKLAARGGGAVIDAGAQALTRAGRAAGLDLADPIDVSSQADNYDALGAEWFGEEEWRSSPLRLAEDVVPELADLDWRASDGVVVVSGPAREMLDVAVAARAVRRGDLGWLARCDDVVSLRYDPAAGELELRSDLLVVHDVQIGAYGVAVASVSGLRITASSGTLAPMGPPTGVVVEAVAERIGGAGVTRDGAETVGAVTFDDVHLWAVGASGLRGEARGAVEIGAGEATDVHAGGASVERVGVEKLSAALGDRVTAKAGAIDARGGRAGGTAVDGASIAGARVDFDPADPSKFDATARSASARGIRGPIGADAVRADDVELRGDPRGLGASARRVDGSGIRGPVSARRASVDRASARVGADGVRFGADRVSAADVGFDGGKVRKLSSTQVRGAAGARGWSAGAGRTSAEGIDTQWGSASSASLDRLGARSGGAATQLSVGGLRATDVQASGASIADARVDALDVGWTGSGRDRVVAGTAAGGSLGGLRRGDLNVDGATFDAGFVRDARGLDAAAHVSADGLSYGSLGARKLTGDLSMSADGGYGASNLAATDLRRGDTGYGDGHVDRATVRPNGDAYDVTASGLGVDRYGAAGSVVATGATADGVGHLSATDLDTWFDAPLPEDPKGRVRVGGTELDGRVSLSSGYVGAGGGKAKLVGDAPNDNQLKFGLHGGVATASTERLKVEDLSAQDGGVRADAAAVTGANVAWGKGGGTAHVDGLEVDGLTIGEAAKRKEKSPDEPERIPAPAERVEDASVSGVVDTPQGKIGANVEVRDNELARASAETGPWRLAADQDEVRVGVDGFSIPLPWWAVNLGGGIAPPTTQGDPEQDWAGPKWDPPPGPQLAPSAPSVKQIVGPSKP